MTHDSEAARAPVLLADYRAPAWRIAAVDLVFDLDLAATEVSARLALEQDRSMGDTPLRLDGDASIELLAISLDGRALSPQEFHFDGGALIVPGARGRCVLETRVRIAPSHNTALAGLYASGPRERAFLLTQCEAEGFRRITYFADRPDVLARYTVTLRAERARFPILLANGNPDGAGELDGGRHWARFVDPHPKPSYLFALVAGRLDHIEDTFMTAEGRRVRLVIWAEPDAIDRCGYAMECLKEAFRWDEHRFGRYYDLDAFHIVATHDFTMGAMENKGLNIFNASYLLARPDMATDDDYRHVLAVVGHEYFHNWSGNRVTCRDWFQLSLKEGLTVYREQEFEADLASRTLRRIEDVRTLWRAQFAEDAGPLSHPVRPDRYVEINNFYTATVYDKGAEIVRMLATLLGRDGFRRGLDRYFERYDGQAVTIENFLAALGEANHRDLGAWLDWYRQPGTPELHVETHHDARVQTFDLTLSQRVATDRKPLPIPVALALFDADGRALPLRLDGETSASATERVITLASERETFRFVGVPTMPVPSLLRGYSAPVRLRYDASARSLGLLVRHDSDGFNRWFAADTLMRQLFASALDRGAADADATRIWTDGLAAAAADASLDPALVAELLTLPGEAELADDRDDVDPEAVHGARARLETTLAQALEPTLEARYAALAGAAEPRTDTATQAQRRLRNRCLVLLCRANARHLALARSHYDRAQTLTDRLIGLTCLVHGNAADAQAALMDFAARYADDPIVLDKWFALQATRPHPDAVEEVVALTSHPAFRWENPNKVYAVFVAFAKRNPRAFHRADGAGYRFVADAIARIDALTPQVAARVATSFGSWRRYEPVRRARMRHELERLSTRAGLSSDVADILDRTLAER